MRTIAKIDLQSSLAFALKASAVADPVHQRSAFLAAVKSRGLLSAGDTDVRRSVRPLAQTELVSGSSATKHAGEPASAGERGSNHGHQTALFEARRVYTLGRARRSRVVQTVSSR